MTKTLLKNLLITFLISMVLTFIAYNVWFARKQTGFEEKQALTLFAIVGSVFHTLLLAIVGLVRLFLSKEANYKNANIRLVLYFGGPVLLTVLLILFLARSLEDKIGMTIPSVVFIVVDTFFYRMFCRKIRANEQVADISFNE